MNRFWKALTVLVLLVSCFIIGEISASVVGAKLGIDPAKPR